MRKSFEHLEEFRCKDYSIWSSEKGDTFGVFIIRIGSYALLCIVGDGHFWDHVSVTVRDKKGRQIKRLPNYNELCKVKNLFFEDDEIVVHYFVPATDHVNINDWCLHLWKHQQKPFPRPPMYMV